MNPGKEHIDTHTLFSIINRNTIKGKKAHTQEEKRARTLTKKKKEEEKKRKAKPAYVYE